MNALEEAEKINKRATLEKLKWEEFPESQLKEVKKDMKDLKAKKE